MPGTHQLMLNGPEGHVLGGWNYPIDARLPHILIDLEAKLADKLGRPIAYNIFDSEGGRLPVALRYERARVPQYTSAPGSSADRFRSLG